MVVCDIEWSLPARNHAKQRHRCGMTDQGTKMRQPFTTRLFSSMLEGLEGLWQRLARYSTILFLAPRQTEDYISQTLYSSQWNVTEYDVGPSQVWIVKSPWYPLLDLSLLAGQLSSHATARTPRGP